MMESILKPIAMRVVILPVLQDDGLNWLNPATDKIKRHFHDSTIKFEHLVNLHRNFKTFANLPRLLTHSFLLNRLLKNELFVNNKLVI